MTPEAKATLDDILAEADGLIRGRLLAAGIRVPHVVMAITDAGDAVVVANCKPNMLLEISKGLRKVAQNNKAPDVSIRH